MVMSIVSKRHDIASKQYPVLPMASSKLSYGTEEINSKYELSHPANNNFIAKTGLSATEYFKDDCVYDTDDTTYMLIDAESGEYEVCYHNYVKDKLSADAVLELENGLKEAAAKVVPATVQIRVKGNDKQSWAGSGVIVSAGELKTRGFEGLDDSKGTYYVLTNHHVANDAKTIKITTADKSLRDVPVEVVSRNGKFLLDGVADVALLKIKSDRALPTAKLGDPKQLKHLDIVMTAGFPLALPNISVTAGIISQPRQMTGEALLAIQTDAPINPGNSGGPLFTKSGEVVGLNTYTFSGANDMSFAQPIDEQLDILLKIWNEGDYVRGDIGVDVVELRESDRIAAGLPDDFKGATLSYVRPGSKAADLGLKSGDVISQIEVLDNNGGVAKMIGIDVKSEFERTLAINEIYSLKPGQQVRTTVYRQDGSSFDGSLSYKAAEVITLPVVKYEPPTNFVSVGWGLSIGKDKNSGALLITDVVKGSPVDEAGLIGGGKKILRGFSANEIYDSVKQNVRSINDVQEMFTVLHSKDVMGVTLYVEDAAMPGRIKAVHLTRDLTSGLLVNVSDDMVCGAETMVA